MSRIASEVDESPIKGGDWHLTLLKRMANEFPGQRKAVITSTTFDALDKLRSFRHRERNSYGVKLDQEIVLERAEECLTAFSDFHSDLMTFKTEMLKLNSKPISISELLQERIRARATQPVASSEDEETPSAPVMR